MDLLIMKRPHLFTLAAILLLAAGCGETVDKSKAGRPATVTAKGTVSYNGKPLDGAVIVLAPKQSTGIAASGISDSNGAFDLQAFPPDSGAVPGDYHVIITKMSTPEQKIIEGGGDGSQSGPPSVSLIPKKYGRPDQSKLSATIPAAGTETLKFDLKD